MFGTGIWYVICGLLPLQIRASAYSPSSPVGATKDCV